MGDSSWRATLAERETFITHWKAGMLLKGIAVQMGWPWHKARNYRDRLLREDAIAPRRKTEGVVLLSVSVTPEQKRKLGMKAASLGMTQSMLVRRLLQRELG